MSSQKTHISQISNSHILKFKELSLQIEDNPYESSQDEKLQFIFVTDEEHNLKQTNDANQEIENYFESNKQKIYSKNMILKDSTTQTDLQQRNFNDKSIQAEKLIEDNNDQPQQDAYSKINKPQIQKESSRTSRNIKEFINNKFKDMDNYSRSSSMLRFQEILFQSKQSSNLNLDKDGTLQQDSKAQNKKSLLDSFNESRDILQSYYKKNTQIDDRNEIYTLFQITQVSQGDINKKGDKVLQNDYLSKNLSSKSNDFSINVRSNQNLHKNKVNFESNSLYQATDRDIQNDIKIKIKKNKCNSRSKSRSKSKSKSSQRLRKSPAIDVKNIMQKIVNNKLKSYYFKRTPSSKSGNREIMKNQDIEKDFQSKNDKIIKEKNKQSGEINVYNNYGIVNVPINNNYEKLEYKPQKNQNFPSTLRSQKIEGNSDFKFFEMLTAEKKASSNLRSHSRKHSPKDFFAIRKKQIDKINRQVQNLIKYQKDDNDQKQVKLSSQSKQLSDKNENDLRQSSKINSILNDIEKNIHKNQQIDEQLYQKIFQQRSQIQSNNINLKNNYFTQRIYGQLCNNLQYPNSFQVNQHYQIPLSIPKKKINLMNNQTKSVKIFGDTNNKKQQMQINQMIQDQQRKSINSMMLVNRSLNFQDLELNAKYKIRKNQQQSQDQLHLISSTKNQQIKQMFQEVFEAKPELENDANEGNHRVLEPNK